MRHQTGTVEPTFRDDAPEGALLLDGQEVSRDRYAALWRWVQEHGELLEQGIFTRGDRVRTFGLPDLRAGARGQAPKGHVPVRMVVWT